MPSQGGYRPPTPQVPPPEAATRHTPATSVISEVQHGQARYVTVMLGVAVTLGALLLMHQFSGIIGPMFMALNLVIAAYPIHSWLRSKGTPGWLSASVMVLAVVVILLAAVVGLSWAVSSMVTELPKHSSQYFALYDQAMELLRRFGINTVGVSDMMQQISPSSVVNILTSTFSSVYAVVAVVVTIIASLIFIAMDTPSMRDRVRASSSDYPPLGRALVDFTSHVRRYWVATTTFGAVVSVLDYLVLIVLGVPLAPVWALLAFVTNYIPNIGFVIGVIPPAVLALLGGGWQVALAVVVSYSVLNFVIQAIIQPRIVGETVGVIPTVSFASLLLWGWVLGPLGTLIALPMTLLFKALLIDTDPKAEWVRALISSQASPRRRRAK